MTKRLSAGVLLFAALVFALAGTASAERLKPREWRPKNDPYRELPVFFRSAPGTAWVSVGDVCDPLEVEFQGDIHSGEQHDSSEVFCFEVPDSLWPNGPAFGPSDSTRQDAWSHWARNNAPSPGPSKWHVTTLHGGAGGGAYNAWVGCDVADPTNPCSDIAFWANTDGYGDEWEETLIADISALGGGLGGTVTFDVRYDTECVYDYLYLEYYNGAGWSVITDTLGAGTACVFNGVSGWLDLNNGGLGKVCDNGGGGLQDGNYYNTSDEQSPSVTAHHMDSWYTSQTFPIPSQTQLFVRWRGSSDPAWSDFDGSGDTDGIGAIDNVSFQFTNGDSAGDGFESGDFDNAVVNGSVSPNFWTNGGAGNTYDGWHLAFDPMYKNKGKVCNFSDDWVWAARPESGDIAESGFEFFLTSPVIPCDGWSGGTCMWSQYQCLESKKTDYSNTYVRVFDTTLGVWSPWNDFDGYITFMGCDFWNMNVADDLTPYLGETVDSLQSAWILLDIDQPGDFEWSNHAQTQYIIDNVAFGSFDGKGTLFNARSVDTFRDTFSRADPAHTPFLKNGEEALYPGRGFANADSLNVTITDQDGLTAANVMIHWRLDTGPGTAYGSWSSKAMNFSVQDNAKPTDEGTYRTTIGNLGGEKYSTDAGMIWDAGTTVEYYCTAVDDSANATSYWPSSATDNPSVYFEFSILPFEISTDGNVAQGHDVDGAPVDSTNLQANFILLVDDMEDRTLLDFENSTEFDPTGGVDPDGGMGSQGVEPNFETGAREEPEWMTEAALAILYGAVDSDADEDWDEHLGETKWDTYNVLGAGSSVQAEPPGVSIPGRGAYMTGVIGAEFYDAIIWLQGNLDEYSFADTTRLELRNFLDGGGCLFTCGDNVAFHLAQAGNDTDSTIHFDRDYFGIDLVNESLRQTNDRTLNFCGTAATPWAGLELGLYAECPLRRTLDRIDLSAPQNGATNTVIGTYCGSTEPTGGSNFSFDNGYPAAIKNVTTGGGTSVFLAFDISALLNDVSRARVLNAFLEGECGFVVPNDPGGFNNGVGAPEIANGFGFSLAQARPNPFTDATSIKFSVPTKTHVSIDVYNILGQRVRTLVNENMEPDSYVRTWDGRSEEGSHVASGIYFYKMVAGDFSATKKAVLLK